METLLEFLEISANDDLRKRIELIERDLNMMAHRRSQVDVLPQTDLDSTFEIAFKRLDAANRAWGITNKLKNPEDRRVNRKRIAANLNILRSLVARLESALASENKRSAGIREDAQKQPVDNYKKIVQAVKGEQVAKKELEKNPFGGKKKKKKLREDVMKKPEKSKESGIEKMKKAVKDEKVTTKELSKNPFKKKK